MSEDLQVVVDSTEREAAAIKAEEAKEVLEGLKDFTIEDTEDLELATDVLKDVKRNLKEITAQKESATKPINQALLQIRSWFKPALDVLEATERMLKSRIEDYHKRVEEQSRRAMAETAAASQAGDFDGAHEAAKGIVTVPKIDGVSLSYTWDYEIVDLSQVPRDYLALDHSKVRIYLRGKKEEPAPIPGLKFFQKGRTTVRT